jgi:CDP-6-deoxy-D-xylo-4-hexulose-3-dehydrase
MAWKLNESNFTWLDRLKICGFFLNTKNFWTMTDQVKEYEEAMAKFVGADHAVFVSSGSTANTILAMFLKEHTYGEKQTTVVVPSTTWITSVSPFIREGFTPHFIDVNLADLSMDLDKLETYLEGNRDQVACVFITSLIGYVPDIERISRISRKYKVHIWMDNCENTLGRYNGNNISSYFTSTTSTYFGHQLQSVEGGFIFTNDKDLYRYALMARNHGMVRSLTEKDRKHYRNPNVDERFDFFILGNNYRNTNINATIGLLDLKRAGYYTKERRDLYKVFTELYKGTKVDIIPMRKSHTPFYDVPFCIPLVFKNTTDKMAAQEHCITKGIEIRPIISGNLLRQSCIRNVTRSDDYKDYPISEHLHANGFYVGLHSKVKPADLADLAWYLNSLG